MHSVRFQLTRMLVISVLPLALVSVFLIYLSYERQYAELERGALRAAHAVGRAVDAEFERIATAARVLATEPGLRRNDVGRFYARAAHGVAGEFGRNLVLSDARARQVLARSGELETLPHDLLPDQVEKVFRTGKPVVSDVFFDRTGGRARVNVDVPVFAEGRVIYDLSVQILPDRFATLLADQSLPQGWVAVVYDSKGVIVTRNVTADKYVGARALPAVLEQMQRKAEGIVQTTGRTTGTPIIVAFSRSELSGWTVSVGMPKALLYAGAREFLYWVSLGMAAMLVIGLGMAALVGSAISRSIRALVAPALALGVGEPVRIPPLAIKEADEVASALREAYGLVRQRTQERDEASVLALRDGLTGLANRRCFDERLKKEWQRCQRAARPLALIMIDIDHFKDFNDHYGHQSGDACLQFVAKVLAASAARASDLVARYGGEEFAVALPEQTLEGARVVAQRILDALRAAAMPHAASPIAPHVTVSMGLATCVPDRASSPQSLVQAADARLYAAKSAGRDRLCCETP